MVLMVLSGDVSQTLMDTRQLLVRMIIPITHVE
jgi:hypothetical protein